MFSLSPNLDSDLQKFSKEIKIIQNQLIDLRIDVSRLNRSITTCVKGIALLVSTPEPDLESEVGTTEDISEGV